MTAPRLRIEKVLVDLALAVWLCIVVAGLCVALAWLVPLQLSPPRIG
jgi:hypothetical protein